MLSTSEPAVTYLEQFVFAPVNHPELLTTLLPLIIGALVLELYLGKHKEEELGWNTSVGNAAIWITTGVTLLLGTSLSASERAATYALIGAGGFVAYMDFYHRWSPRLAFRISSAAIIYTLAYVLVVMVKTSIPVNEPSLKAAGVFVVAAVTGFKLLQLLETPARDNFRGFRR